MNDKQKYYASLERQRSAEDLLRGSGPVFHESSALDDLYADMGMRAFAAFQNCLDWLGSIGGKRVSAIPDGGGQVVDKVVTDTLGEMADALHALQEQVGRVEAAIANVEAGMRRIDKYTLDAFRQLSELDAARVVQAQQTNVEEPQGSRRLAKEEAVRLAIEAAERMAKAGQQLSLAAVAREAGLKYGQIVYAFGNKDTFLARLAAISGAVAQSSQAGEKERVQNEVAATEEPASAS